MNDDNPFLVSDEQLLSLRATRQGRISLAGYNYQAAYAVLRLARLVIPITPEDEDHPVRLRYDWGEDLDEVWSGGQVCFTQCKRVNSIGQPQPMTEVLESFAAKWVMMPEEEQHCIRFRLVCTDPRFAGEVLLSKGCNRERDKIKEHFCRNLERPPHARADRKLWQRQADSLGHEFLFDAIWEQTEAFYLPNRVYGSHPAGALLEGEREALSLLLTYGKIEQAQQEKALNRLRGLIHNNLIEFDPVSDQTPSLPILEPRHIVSADVDNALFGCRHGIQSPLLFGVVDRSFLAEQKALPKEPFVARPPTWPDVVHGQDNVVKFLERDQTEDLQGRLVQDLVLLLERGVDNRLHALFVIGPPGAGKSTLVRRVLARLVDQGRVIVADASTGLPLLGEADTYRRQLAELALPGRPVILLVDDPLYAESSWLDLLPKLVHSNLRLGLIAATPTFLFDRHHQRLPPQHIVSHRYDMRLPTDYERQRFGELYGRTPQEVSNETDFLVLAMELATGRPFDQIIKKLWWTLNDHRPLPAPDEPIARLNWPARAFLVVCFFHRVYVPCLEPLIEKALELSGGIKSGIPVADALAHLRFTEGWHVFQLREADEVNWAYQGRYITAAHHRIAQRAYELRPVPSVDLGALVIKASIAAPQTARQVGALAAILADASDDPDQRFGERLVKEWIFAAEEGLIETRYLYDLATSLNINGQYRLARRLYEVLISRAATCNQDAWLAALALWYLSAEHPNLQSYPPELDLLSLVQRSDFSIAPLRALGFATRLPPQGPAQKAFKERLSQALKGEVPWRLSSYLLTWLLANSQADQFPSMFPAIQAWLREHPHDPSVREQFLVFLLKLPKGFDNVCGEVAKETLGWLRDHLHDSSVRTQLLAFLLKLPQGFDSMRVEVAKETLDWLRNHPEDTYVRAKLCDFLLRLTSQFKGLRQHAASALMDWLVSTSVAGIPTEFLTQQAVKEVALLSFKLTAKAGSIENLSRALLWGIKLLNEHGVRNDIGDYVAAMVDAYHELASKSKSLADPIAAYDILRSAKKAIGGWCDRNPAAIGYPWL